MRDLISNFAYRFDTLMAVKKGFQLIFGISQREQKPEEIKVSALEQLCFLKEKTKLLFLKMSSDESVKPLLVDGQAHFE